MFRYETMAMDLDNLAKACFKQAPVPVVNVTKEKPGERVHRKGVCPICYTKNDAAMVLDKQFPYCPFCGQKLDWANLNKFEDYMEGKGEKNE